MFTIDYNAATGLIRCTAGGFMTVAEVLQYSSKLREAVTESRRKFGYFKMLSVALDSTVQSPEVLKTIHENKAYAIGPRDRVAIVTSGILQKGQGMRVFGQEQERMFGSEPEAMAWLMSDGADREAARPGDLRKTLAN